MRSIHHANSNHRLYTLAFSSLTTPSIRTFAYPRDSNATTEEGKEPKSRLEVKLIIEIGLGNLLHCFRILHFAVSEVIRGDIVAQPQLQTAIFGHIDFIEMFVTLPGLLIYSNKAIFRDN